MKKTKTPTAKKLNEFIQKNEFKIVTWRGQFKELKINVVFEDETGKRVTKCYAFKHATHYSHFNREIRRIYNEQ